MTEQELMTRLSDPDPQTVDLMRSLDGDIIILGVAGKMGVTLALMAREAIRRAGVTKSVIGVARFSDETARKTLEEQGIQTIRCDLSQQEEVRRLPKVANVIFMAGRKFGTTDNETLTWIMNVIVPGYVADHFRDSRIVAFSTGCVYPLVPFTGGGSTEQDEPHPVGEYAQSCLGRERIFEYYSRKHKTRVCLFRLNYAIDLRYGVLHDIARRVYDGEPVDLTVGYFNCIWQGDANNRALLSLEHTSSPAKLLNITGPETISVRQIAERFGTLFGKRVSFSSSPADRNYLSNAAHSMGLFGYPGVSLETMLEWTAEWIRSGGSSLNKPTHFEVSDGTY